MESILDRFPVPQKVLFGNDYSYIVIESDGRVFAYRTKRDDKPKIEAMSEIPEHTGWKEMAWSTLDAGVQRLHIVSAHDVSFFTLLCEEQKAAADAGQPIPVSRSVWNLMHNASTHTITGTGRVDEVLYLIYGIAKVPFPGFPYSEISITLGNGDEKITTIYIQQLRKAEQLNDRYLFFPQGKEETYPKELRTLLATG